MEDKKKKNKSNNVLMTNKDKRFSLQGLYAESILQSSLGKIESSIVALEQALKIDPEYAPAILSMGSVEYKRGNTERGKKLLLSLVSLPASAADGGESDLAVIIDEAGDFLIQTSNYADGLELFKAAAVRFPNQAVFHQGIGCCAGHEGLLDEAISASRVALELEPENQNYINDLGWSLFKASRLAEAKRILSRAVDMDPSDELARENLRLCTKAINENTQEE